MRRCRVCIHNVTEILSSTVFHGKPREDPQRSPGLEKHKGVLKLLQALSTLQSLAGRIVRPSTQIAPLKWSPPFLLQNSTTSAELPGSCQELHGIYLYLLLDAVIPIAHGASWKCTLQFGNSCICNGAAWSCQKYMSMHVVWWLSSSVCLLTELLTKAVKSRQGLCPSFYPTWGVLWSSS